MSSEPTDALLKAARLALPPWHHDRPFEFAVAFADRYEILLAGDYESHSDDLDAIVGAAFEHGRLLIAAEAGAGKTSLTARALTHAVDHGVVGVLADLRRWSPEVHDAWKSMRDSDTRRMGLLLEQLTDLAATERTLRETSHHARTLIVVDGLNEVPPSATRELLWVLDAFAARSPWAAVIVCDRLQRRPLPSTNWYLATITAVRPVGDDGESGPPNALLLDIAATATADNVYNEAETLRGHLIARAELGGEDVHALEDTCLRLYGQFRDGQGRFFVTQELREGVGDDVTARLLASGEVIEEGDRAFFRHHLFHDAFAAGAVARDHDRWRRECLDALTFEANSFDAVALALELLDTTTDADAFVIAVYDWNLYAAAYAVSHGRRHGSIAVSASMELALLAVLAERRWDPVSPSVQRVEDALRVSPAPLAQRLLAASDVDEVIALVREAADDQAAKQWLPLFAGELSPEQMVDALSHGPVDGWIASNVLRRQPLGDESRYAILRALGDPDGTIRWRAAHTLGADKSDQAVEGLLGVLDGDDWHWARYGAVRALVEIAAHDDDRRRRIVEELRVRLSALQQQERVFRELQDALQLREPPTGWATAVAPLIEELFARAATVSEQDHWRRVGRRISESVRVARHAQPA